MRRGKADITARPKERTRRPRGQRLGWEYGWRRVGDGSAKRLATGLAMGWATGLAMGWATVSKMGPVTLAVRLATGSTTGSEGNAARESQCHTPMPQETQKSKLEPIEIGRRRRTMPICAQPRASECVTLLLPSPTKQSLIPSSEPLKSGSARLCLK